MKFELNPESVKIKKILRKDFLEVEMRAISTAYPNRNNSHFTRESLVKAIPTVYNKPLLGSFSVDNNDFRQHNSELKYDNELGDLYYDYTDPTSETPIGLIRSEDKVVVRDDENTGESWLCFTASIWVKYNYKQVKSLLKSKNGKKKVSVEVEVLDSYVDEKGIEVIKEFSFMGVTLLSDAVECGISGAEMSILDMVSSSLFQKKQKCLCYAYDSLKNNNLNNQNDVDNNINQNFSSSTVENIKPFENEKPVENEDAREITMVQEGGNQKMLTYEAKREVLEAYLRSNLRHCEDECCWVCDLDDNFVYFYFKDMHYSAPYVITEDAMGNGIAVVNLEAKQPVVHSWSVFSEDEKEDDKEKKSFDDDGDDENKDEGHGEGEHGEDDDDEDEEKDEDEKDDDEDDDDGEGKEDDDDDEEENNPVIVESACGEKETQACENKETEVCNPEDKQTEACNPENKETEACKTTEACNPENKQTESATFSAENHQEFIMLDNEQLSINQLLDKYNELHQQFAELNEKYTALDEKYIDVNEKYSAFMAQEEEKNINSMISFGCSFIENESRLSDSDKKAFSEEITEKCKNKYFENQDSLKKFVLTKIAVSLYNAEYESKNNPNNKDNKTDFCVDIVKPTDNHVLTGIEKLKEANKKLNKI